MDYCHGLTFWHRGLREYQLLFQSCSHWISVRVPEGQKFLILDVAYLLRLNLYNLGKRLVAFTPLLPVSSS